MVVHNGWLPFIYFKKWQAEKGAEFWMDYMKGEINLQFRLCQKMSREDEPYMMADMMKRSDPRIQLLLLTARTHAVTSAVSLVETWLKFIPMAQFHLLLCIGAGVSIMSLQEGTMDMDKILQTIQANCCENA